MKNKKTVYNHNLKHIFECGQVFHYDKINDNEYLCIFENYLVHLKINTLLDNSSELEYKFISEYNDSEKLFHYLDHDTNYNKIKSKLYGNTHIMDTAIEYGSGIRILNQPLFETLISFIISANNNITRIRNSVFEISKRWGDYIATYNDVKYYAFPTIEQLLDASIHELRECGVGFRDKYIYESIRMIINNEVDIYNLYEIDYNDAKKELMKLKGIGSKVADCILLFSYGYRNAFPVDTWIAKVMNSFYFNSNKSKSEIEEYAKDTFKEYGGYAQQYLFYYAQQNKIKN